MSTAWASATHKNAGTIRERDMPDSVAGPTPAATGDEACMLAGTEGGVAGGVGGTMSHHERQMNKEMHKVAIKPMNKTISSS